MKLDIKRMQELLLKQFGLNITSHDYIKEGVVNDNFILVGDAQDKYILKIYNRTNEDNIIFELDILNELKKSGIGAPQPLISKDGNQLFDWDGRTAILYPYIEGVVPEKLEDNELRSVGEHLAKFHSTLKDFYPRTKKITWDPDDLKSLIQSESQNFLKEYNPFAKDVLPFVEKEIRKYTFPKKLPQGIAHQDIKPENVVLDENFVYFLDFGNSYRGALLHDITTAIIWKCFINEKLDETLLQTFLEGYESHRPLERSEREYLRRGILWRLAREVFIGPYAAVRMSDEVWKRSAYFKRLYKNLLHTTIEI